MVLKSEMSSLNRKKKNKVLYRDMTLLNCFFLYDVYSSSCYDHIIVLCACHVTGELPVAVIKLSHLQMQTIHLITSMIHHYHHFIPLCIAGLFFRNFSS